MPSQLQLCNEECMRVRERVYMCAYVTCVSYVYYIDGAIRSQKVSLDVDLGTSPKRILADECHVLPPLLLYY